MNVPAQPRILVVDDDRPVIELVDAIFGERCEVLFATNGEQALTLAGTAAPDVILLDVLLPGLDGFEVCARLKADPLTAEIPIIFVTGLGDTAAETRGLELGAMDYIAKPINPPVMRMRVDNQIELKRARDRLARLAVTDGLTGLANRRRFDEMLRLEHARHGRSGGYLTLVMIDLDHFKRYNDTYGHLRGDDCLRAVAGALERALLRPADLAARLGGEEFACILPETGPPEEVAAVAERIRQEVLRLALPHLASPTAPVVTISLGVATARCQGDRSPLDLLEAADAELYRAKSLGRNCVCVRRCESPVVSPPVKPGMDRYSGTPPGSRFDQKQG